MTDDQTLIGTQITEIEDAHASGAYPRRPLALVRGDGCTLYDDAGNAYLDAASGMGVALLGHAHPAVADAIRAQAETLITCPEIFYNDRRAALYSTLGALLPSEIDRFFLANSGAEAVEGALKAARVLTGRDQVVAVRRGFHGRTLGALGLTWNPTYRKDFDGWTPDGVSHVRAGDLDAAREAITQDTAAIMVEPVQGEGGVHPLEADYLRGLREICDATGTLLILDEIQTGMGRTGRWFGFQHAEIVPDMVTLGKGVAGGVPMGVVAWRGVLGTLPGKSHGSTFGGNPLAASAAVAAMDALREAGVPGRVAELGGWLMDELRARDLPGVREVRGQGLLIGLELRGKVTPVLKAMQARGVIALPAGKNVLRLLPPLIITQEELTTVINVTADALAEVYA